MAAVAEQLGISPKSDAHVSISGNAFALLKNHLRGTGCRVYMSDMKVRVKQDTAFFYPDVMVTCDPADLQRSHYKHAPTLIIEVLSPSTEAYDRGNKFALYRELDSLQEYVLINPRPYAVDVFRRNEYGRWELFAFSGETANVSFASVDYECTMRDLYEDVNFALDETPKSGPFQL